MSGLEKFTADELRDELRRRSEAAVCECGPARRPYVERTGGFLPRTGCLTCNRWDSKPVLVRP